MKFVSLNERAEKSQAPLSSVPSAFQFLSAREQVGAILARTATQLFDESRCGSGRQAFFTTKPAGEGTGLGLSISHDIIVKQHGGSIEVDTQPGKFTEFRIVLPRAGASLIQSGDRASHFPTPVQN